MAGEMGFNVTRKSGAHPKDEPGVDFPVQITCLLEGKMFNV